MKICIKPVGNQILLSPVITGAMRAVGAAHTEPAPCSSSVAFARQSGHRFCSMSSRAYNGCLAFGETTCNPLITRSVINPQMREHTLSTTARNGGRACEQIFGSIEMPRYKNHNS
jgi:hypothetical protein